MDMAQIQAALQRRKKRRGFGRELQIACPERVYGNTQWIDALEKPLLCPGPDATLASASAAGNTPEPELDVVALRQSALAQCGAWCIANQHDLADAGGAADGWELISGSGCFRPIFHLDGEDAGGGADANGNNRSACRDALRRLKRRRRGDEKD